MDVTEHYTRPDLGEAILAALKDLGKGLDNLTPVDLAAVDEFHVRGGEATMEVAELARIDADDHLLDIGCGIGGPARHLASRFGCRVIGLDLTEEYCRVATMLTERTGLDGLVNFRQGDALNLPFDDDRFDVVWTQHACMNIPRKDRLYAEMHRVLKPGGRLAIYDVFAGTGGAIHYPVPWAREPSISFVISPADLRAHLDAFGLEILSWVEVSDLARDWFRAMTKRMAENAPPPLGLHLLLGPEFPKMAGNMRRNLDEARLALVQVVARKI